MGMKIGFEHFCNVTTVMWLGNLGARVCCLSVCECLPYGAVRVWIQVLAHLHFHCCLVLLMAILWRVADSVLWHELDQGRDLTSPVSWGKNRIAFLASFLESQSNLGINSNSP